MKKKRIVFSAVCLLVLAAAIMTGCGPKLEEPVFVKSLISAEDMDVDTQYITDETWEKKVKNLEIPDAPPDISIYIYDQQYEEESGYRLHTISWGVGTSKLNEDSSMAVPLEFDHLQITWDDGSTSTADVGHVKICSLKEKGFVTTREEAGYTQDDENYEAMAFKAKRPMDITGIEIPYEKELFQVITSLEINDIPYDEIDFQDPIHLEKGESCTVGYSIDDKKRSKYGTVFVEAQLVGVDKQGERQAGTFRMIDRMGMGLDIGAYLKRVKDQ
ncbi:MAG: hypothetical protein SOR93_11840 [Clostridiales Family XIII bacterium]|nr:hypothetical protein [Clostridia bacterium]MDY3011925.1 hypothetical protein [Clostridiales Family XIII bacterium]